MRRLVLFLTTFALFAFSQPSSAADTPAPPRETAARAFQVTKTGAGRAMILIPGLMSSGDVWSGAVARFKGRYECHVLTLAGFAGQPPLPQVADGGGTVFFDTVRREIVEYIKAQRLDRPIIVGHSLGGFVAFSIASAHPDLVGPVIAIDGVPFLSALMNPEADAAAARPQAQQLRDLYASLTPAQLAAQSKLALGSMMKSPADVDRAAAWSAASDPKTAGAAMYEMMTTDLRPVVASIRTPVLLVGAAEFAKDAETRARVRASYERQVAAVPIHRVVMAEEARHFIMWDAPEFLWTTIEGFFAESDARPATGASRSEGK